MIRISQRVWPAVLGLLLSSAAMAAAPSTPAGLMIHVPLDGSVADVRGLGAVLSEAEGKPSFNAGVAGEAGTPESGRRHVGMLHVSRLAWLMLRGRTPATGTIMLWAKLPPALAAADTATPARTDTSRLLVLSSDAPLNLDVEVGVHPRQVHAAFDDDAGVRREALAPIPGGESWVHLALGWDAAAGTIVVFVQGHAVTSDAGPDFKMPGLPRVFALGAPETAIDDFRLYNRLLSSEEVAMLPGLTAAPR